MAKTRINSRRKGHQYERDTAAWYRDLGYTVKRGLQSRHGDEASDVEGDREFPFSVECKHYASLGLTGRAWKQATDCAVAASIGSAVKTPVLHLHETNGPHLVVINRLHWKRILERLKAGKDG